MDSGTLTVAEGSGKGFAEICSAEDECLDGDLSLSRLDGSSAIVDDFGSGTSGVDEFGSGTSGVDDFDSGTSGVDDFDPGTSGVDEFGSGTSGVDDFGPGTWVVDEGRSVEDLFDEAGLPHTFLLLLL